jgi:excisionase family DNA binding protein
MLNHTDHNSKMPQVGSTAYLRRQDVAARLGVSVRTVERWALDGGGPPMVVVGNIRFYPESDLEAWLRSRLSASTSNAQARRA